MNMKISRILMILIVVFINGYQAMDCGNGDSCDVGITFLHSTYCCKDSSDKPACCKELRWWPLAVTICAAFLVLIIIFICSCCYGLFSCITDILCCFCKR
ncbi:unnamed protein product [Schistosoma margrebowiei]|uniref:Uncharacterized protein n=1 Tax=Schistosoma margrebowiei TaxID=48269 RepID=A0AA85AN67_9TREM|nr:unnamed protein product [Schistosoma margrebowiei]